MQQANEMGYCTYRASLYISFVPHQMMMYYMPFERYIQSSSASDIALYIGTEHESAVSFAIMMQMIGYDQCH